MEWAEEITASFDTPNTSSRAVEKELAELCFAYVGAKNECTKIGGEVLNGGAQQQTVEMKTKGLYRV